MDVIGNRNRLSRIDIVKVGRNTHELEVWMVAEQDKIATGPEQTNDFPIKWLQAWQVFGRQRADNKIVCASCQGSISDIFEEDLAVNQPPFGVSNHLTGQVHSVDLLHSLADKPLASTASSTSKISDSGHVLPLN